MRTRVLVMRAVFIGLTIIFGIFWCVWMFDMNAYTKFQFLWGSIDMTMLRRILAAMCLISIGGIAVTLHFSKKSYYFIVAAVLAVIYGTGLLISVKVEPDTAYYTYSDSGKEIVVMEETKGDRRQAVFYERKNPMIVEYLGNMDYYGDESAFLSGNCDISWLKDGELLVKVRAQFENNDSKELPWSDASYMETRETKEQIFYVEEQ